MSLAFQTKDGFTLECMRRMPIMRWRALSMLIVFTTLSFHVSRAAASDWDPVTDAEKTMKSNPLDPGAGAVVLFKGGQIDVIQKSRLFWTTLVRTYRRLNGINDDGRADDICSIEWPSMV